MPNALLIVILGVCGLAQAPTKSPGEPSAPVPDTQVIFWGPEGMTVVCDTGSGEWYDSEPLVVPGRRNVRQGLIYSLKLAGISSHPGVELYATLEVVMAVPRTTTFLERNAVPVTFAEDDIATVCSGKPVTKVTYLPAPEFRELVLHVEAIVSYRLDPGADPITESARRGDVMVVLRIKPGAASAAQRCDEARPTQACRSARFAGRLRCRFGRR